MKFLADENIGQTLIFFLKKKGFDITSIAQSYPGISDQEVLKKGQKRKKNSDYSR